MTMEKSKQLANESQGASARASSAGSGPGPGAPAARITVTRNGPYIVEGAVPLANQTIESDSEGGSREWLQGQPFVCAHGRGGEVLGGELAGARRAARVRRARAGVRARGRGRLFGGARGS